MAPQQPGHAQPIGARRRRDLEVGMNSIITDAPLEITSLINLVPEVRFPLIAKKI